MESTTTTSKQSILAAIWYGNDEHTFFESVMYNSARFLGLGTLAVFTWAAVKKVHSKATDPTGEKLVAKARAEAERRRSALMAKGVNMGTNSPRLAQKAEMEIEA